MNEDKRRRTRRNRWIAGLLGAAALLAALVWAYRPRPLLVEVGAASLGRFEQVIEEDGQLRLRERYTVSAPTAAQLLRPALKVGDPVRAGEVVAQLVPVAPQMIDARTREVLQQRVGSADAARRAAAAQVLRQQTALAQATLEAERAVQLARDRFIAASARDQAELARQAARQSLAAAEAEQRVAAYGHAEALAALGRAEPAAGRAEPGLWALKSPVDGQVIRLHRDNAGPVSAGEPLLELGDTAAMEAVIDVLSGEVARIGAGAPVSMALGGGAPALLGRVLRIEPVAFTKVSALGIEEQRVKVIVGLDPPARGAGAPPPRLGEGYRVDARITVSAQERVLRVPSAALVRDGSQWRVFAVVDGRAASRTVQVVDRNADLAWIREGLPDGTPVVLYPGGKLVDGQRLRWRAAPVTPPATPP